MLTVNRPRTELKIDAPIPPLLVDAGAGAGAGAGADAGIPAPAPDPAREGAALAPPEVVEESDEVRLKAGAASGAAATGVVVGVGSGPLWEVDGVDVVDVVGAVGAAP